MVNYEVQGNIVVIMGCSKDEVNLELPDEIEGYPVGKIDANSFNNNNTLERVVIPSSCKVIGAYAFAACKNLKEVIIEDGVEVIEDWAFISCGIERISLPQSLKSVGNNAFLGTNIKDDVTLFLEKMSSMRRPKNHTNNKCAIFPWAFDSKKNLIDDQFIQSQSKYIDSEFDKVTEETITEDLMDLPLLYDGCEFLLAIYNRKALEKLKVELASEYNTQIGLYSLTDPEFLVLRVNVLTNGQFISSFFIRTPYIESCNFKCIGVEMMQKDGMYYYFLHLKIELASYGNGNYNHAFMINQFNALINKYQSKTNNHKINDEQLQYIYEKLNEKIYTTTESFLTELDGAPRLLYFMNLIKAILNDNESTFDLDKIQTFYTNFIFNAYNELSSIESLIKIAFDDIDDLIVELEEMTQVSNYDLATKYDVAITDSVGNEMTLEEAKAKKDSFINLEANYKLHAQYLSYIYTESRIMNDEYSMFEYEGIKEKEE